MKFDLYEPKLINKPKIRGKGWGVGVSVSSGGNSVKDIKGNSQVGVRLTYTY